ncbi:MAG: rod shape-determining protein MreD [Pseudomonadota bacterium]|nr:rod shape-determining protein MreD [Pseudomonadota bacterium]
MKSGPEQFRQRIERGFRVIIPSIITFILTLLTVVPYGIPELNRAMPLLPLVGIFFWSIHCPALYPIFVSFFLGLLQDSLGGTPIGFSSAIYLAMHALVGYQHTFFHDKNFLVLWCAFSVLSAVIVVLGYIVLVIFHLALLPVTPILMQLLVTIAIYPLVTRFLQVVMRYTMHRV